jgi:ABC-type branched-subunit amino acid transport system permease subunit
MGTEEGPSVGTIIIVILYFLLSKYGAMSLLIQGVILIAIMLLVPKGIIGFIRKTRAYSAIRVYQEMLRKK